MLPHQSRFTSAAGFPFTEAENSADKSWQLDRSYTLNRLSPRIYWGPMSNSGILASYSIRCLEAGLGKNGKKVLVYWGGSWLEEP